MRLAPTKFPVGLQPTKLAGTCRSSEEGKDRGVGGGGGGGGLEGSFV